MEYQTEIEFEVRSRDGSYLNQLENILSSANEFHLEALSGSGNRHVALIYIDGDEVGKCLAIVDSVLRHAVMTATSGSTPKIISWKIKEARQTVK